MVKSLGVLFEAGLADNTKKAQHGGAVSVAGDHYKVIQENDKVRILEFRGKPVDKTEMHSHSNIVAIPMSDAKVRFTGATGQSMEIELGAG